jgi:hypothetical protein
LLEFYLLARGAQVCATSPGLSTEASHPGGALGATTASSYAVGFATWGRPFARRRPLCGYRRYFTAIASARFARRGTDPAHAGSLAADLLRPSAEEASPRLTDL